MLDYLDTVELKDLNTYKYNDRHRPLNNGGNSVGHSSDHRLDHLNYYSIFNGTKCIVLF